MREIYYLRQSINQRRETLERSVWANIPCAQKWTVMAQETSNLIGCHWGFKGWDPEVVQEAIISQHHDRHLRGTLLLPSICSYNLACFKALGWPSPAPFSMSNTSFRNGVCCATGVYELIYRNLWQKWPRNFSIMFVPWPWPWPLTHRDPCDLNKGMAAHQWPANFTGYVRRHSCPCTGICYPLLINFGSCKLCYYKLQTASILLIRHVFQTQTATVSFAFPSDLIISLFYICFRVSCLVQTSIYEFINEKNLE